jgi:hypothetical protein
VLQLDAGDFGEGTSFFLSQEGSSSVKALEVLGAEISVIGNHDHMLGGNILGKQIRKANVKTKFLSANLVQTSEMELGNLIKPFVDVDRGRIKIREIILPNIIPYVGGRIFPMRMRVGGRLIKNTNDYVVAFSSEVAFALKETIPAATKNLFPNLKYTGQYYWSVMENYIRQNSPIRCD